MQKGQIQIFLIGILITAVVAFGAYYLGRSTVSKPSPSPAISQTPQPSPDETVYTEDTRSANWKTYTSTKLGISFKYPIDGKIKEGGSYGVDNIFLEDPDSVSLLVDDGQMTISMEQTEKESIESFMSDYKSFDGEIGLDYEGNKVEYMYIDGIQTLKGVVAGPKSNRVFTLIHNNKVYRISFEPVIGESGALILNTFKFIN
ncbi:MAG: hypothetical protein Q8P92_05755 [Candidatus Daviesbacteria bacterium]|nr:hypothetical protein [Candidatus Daviesbacteria bacterium]